MIPNNRIQSADKLHYRETLNSNKNNKLNILDSKEEFKAKTNIKNLKISRNFQDINDTSIIINNIKIKYLIEQLIIFKKNCVKVT